MVASNGTSASTLHTSSMEDLSKRIALSTNTISKFLQEKGHPQPSLASGSLRAFPEDAPSDVQDARKELLQATKTLHQLALYPKEAVKQWFFQPFTIAPFHFIIHYKVADHVPLTGSISYSSLAQKLGVPQRRTIRFLRAAMAEYFFSEPQPGHVAHTSLSANIISTEPGYHLMALTHEMYMPAIPKYVEAGEGATDGAYSLVYDTKGKNFFDWVAQDDERMALLQNGMGATMNDSQIGIEPLVMAYDWPQSGVVVDVGGGTGPVSRMIATHTSKALKFIVQDQATAISQAPVSGDDGRISYAIHDLFTPNPVIGAEIYFMRWIPHDWPDDAAAEILRNVAVSMKPNYSRLILCEAVLPLPGEVDIITDKIFRGMDLLMMVHNGCERTREHWEELVEMVGQGLKIERVVGIEGCMLSLIEIWKRE